MIPFLKICHPSNHLNIFDPGHLSPPPLPLNSAMSADKILVSTTKFIAKLPPLCKCCRWSWIIASDANIRRIGTHHANAIVAVEFFYLVIPEQERTVADVLLAACRVRVAAPDDDRCPTRPPPMNYANLCARIQGSDQYTLVELGTEYLCKFLHTGFQDSHNARFLGRPVAYPTPYGQGLGDGWIEVPSERFPGPDRKQPELHCVLHTWRAGVKIIYDCVNRSLNADNLVLPDQFISGGWNKFNYKGGSHAEPHKT